MAAPKQPQDHKLKAAEAEAAKKPFPFTGKDGETYELPFFSTSDAGLTSGFVRRNRKNEAELIYTVVEALASDEALAALDEFSQAEFGDIIKAWQEAAGSDLPK